MSTGGSHEGEAPASGTELSAAAQSDARRAALQERLRLAKDDAQAIAQETAVVDATIATVNAVTARDQAELDRVCTQLRARAPDVRARAEMDQQTIFRVEVRKAGIQLVAF